VGEVAAGATLVALAARVSVPVPASPTPQSLQTLAVVLTGGWLGPARAGMAIAVYLALGASGLPVFADGAAGWRHLTDPTAGYLYGFLLGALVMGERRGGLAPREFALTFARAGLAHVLVLGAGWLRLGALVGYETAFDSGVRPFLLGAVWKSLITAVLLGVAGVSPGRRRRER